MDWIPTVFIAFKVSVLLIGMFFAVKWHHDKARKQNGEGTRRGALLASAQVVAIFVVLLVALLLVTFGLGRMLGLDLSFP